MPRHPNDISPDAPYRTTAAAYREVLAVSKNSNDRLEELLRPPGVAGRWLSPAYHGTARLPDDHFERLLGWNKLSEEMRCALRDARLSDDIRVALEPSGHAPPELRLDVVGIGALNVDHVAPRSQSITERDAEDGTLFIELGTERVAASQDEIASDLKQLAATSFEHRLGGSTFNVIRLLSTPELGCRTGFIGVQGTRPGRMVLQSGVPMHRQLLRDICDVRYLWTSPKRPAGRCLSLVTPAVGHGSNVERSMSTWPGANDELFQHLKANFWALVDYLSQTRIVHVSSIIDPASSDLLASLLEVVKVRSPHVEISIDPGYIWAERHYDYVARLLRTATILFVNERELHLLAQNYARHRVNLTADEQAAALLKLLTRLDAVIVVKYAGGTVVYGRDGTVEIELSEPLINNIEDDTGAGDVFAAGFLAARSSKRLTAKLGAGYGMSLARAKLVKNAMPDSGTVCSLADAAASPGAQWVVRRRVPPRRRTPRGVSPETAKASVREPNADPNG